jgi:hypothetical protein
MNILILPQSIVCAARDARTRKIPSESEKTVAAAEIGGEYELKIETG